MLLAPPSYEEVDLHDKLEVKPSHFMPNDPSAPIYDEKSEI